MMTPTLMSALPTAPADTLAENIDNPLNKNELSAKDDSSPVFASLLAGLDADSPAAPSPAPGAACPMPVIAGRQAPDGSTGNGLPPGNLAPSLLSASPPGTAPAGEEGVLPASEPAPRLLPPTQSLRPAVPLSGGPQQGAATAGGPLVMSGAGQAEDAGMEMLKILEGAWEARLPGGRQEIVVGMSTADRSGPLPSLSLGGAPGVNDPANGLVGRSGAQDGLRIDLPVQHSAWGDALASRVQWVTGQRLQGAQLRLDPPDLGPLDVRISVDKDQASVTFVSHHALVRDAVESAIPRLREMLAENGIDLVNVDVREHGQSDRGHHEAQPGDDGRPTDAGLISPHDENQVINNRIVSTSLVDFYA